MSFNSIEFYIYFFVILIIYQIIKKNNSKWIVLLISSLIFYYYNSKIHIAIIVYISIVDYFCALNIYNKTHKNLWFSLSIINNLLILSYYKYLSNAPFPLGLSFYCFQSLGYLFDVKINKKEPVKNYFKYLGFLSFFPQLISGPICKIDQLLNQLEKPSLNPNYLRAFELIILGLFKKVFLADHLALLINSMLNRNLSLYSFNETWIMMIGFGFQIYYDFSGYTDIARGIAKCFGIDLPINFNFPYFSTSLTIFWRKWHITLSTWFKENIYFNTNSKGKNQIQLYLSLFFTFILSGMWHGSSFNFALWGLFHALFVSIEKLLKIDNINHSSPIINFINIVRTFILITFSWVLFKIEDINKIKILVNKMIFYSKSIIHSIEINRILILLVFGIILEIYLYYKKKRNLNFVLILLLSILITFFRSQGSDFIYYRF